MDKVAIFLFCIAVFAILCQWCVFLSIRKYLFGRYRSITRRVAYPVLGGLGLANLMGIQLAFGGMLFTPDSFGRKAATAAFFTYLGMVLGLTVFFLILSLFNCGLDIFALIRRAMLQTGRAWHCPASGERGCLTSDSLESTMGEHTASPGTDHSGAKGNPLCAQRQDEEELPGMAPSVNRRQFLKWSAAAGIVSTVGLGGYGLAAGYGEPKREVFDLTFPSLSGLNRPLTLIHITDFHFGLFFGRKELEDLVARVNAIEGDALLITGDVFHSAISPVEMAGPILRKLRERPSGNFVIFGNHDFYAGEPRSLETFKAGNLTILRNQWTSFRHGGVTVHLGGIDDPLTNWMFAKDFPQFTKFLGSAPKEPGARILLSHRPGVLPRASQAGIDLVLAGHIHGGQIILPMGGRDRGISLARIASPYTHGWYRHGNSRMYLNRGVGLTFVPWRINCPPEIAVLRLVPPA